MNERTTHRRAETGVGALVVAVLPELDALVLEYLDGESDQPRSRCAAAIGIEPIAEVGLPPLDGVRRLVTT